MHIMIDLETMGSTPSAPMVAIGACRFDENGVQDGAFYRKIALKSSVEAGATMDADTVIWWLGKSEAARAEIISAEGDEWEALCDFSQWIGPTDDLEGIWGNGAAFDNTILAASYRRYGQEAPWPFSLDRCYRTVKAFSPVEMHREGTHHNAMDDAISQAKHLVAIWNHSRNADVTDAAKKSLHAIDTFMSGAKLSDEQNALQRRVSMAGSFAAQAFDSFPIQSGGEFHALTRTFLLAIIDPLHEDLDYLRKDPASGAVAREAAAQKEQSHD